MPDPAGSGPLSLGRRRFMVAVAGGLLAAPVVAEAQQAEKVYGLRFSEISRSRTPRERLWGALIQEVRSPAERMFM